MYKPKHTSGKWCKCLIDNEKTAVLLNQAGKWHWTDTSNCINTNNRKIIPLKVMGEVADYCHREEDIERGRMRYLMIDYNRNTYQLLKNTASLKDTISDLFPEPILTERQEEGKLIFLDLQTQEQITIRREVIWDIKIIRT